MARKYTLLIGGSEVDLWESIDFDNSLDLEVNKAAIQFPDSSDLLSAEGLGQDIIIQRDGVAIWRGLGVSNQKIYGLDGKKQYNLNCLSNKQYLQREIFQKNGSYVAPYGGAGSGSSPPSTPNQTLATSILQDIMNSQYSANLTQGKVGSVNIPHVALYITRQTALQVLSQLIAGSLWEARVNTDNTVDFLPLVGSQSSVYTFQSDENLMKTEVDYGIDKLINNVIVCGGGSQSGQIVNASVENVSSVNQFGRWSKIVSLSNCLDPNMLQAYANALLDDLNSYVYTVNGQLADLSTGVPFRPGDYVTVNNSSFNLNNALFRFVSEHRHYDASEAEDVQVVLAQNYRMVNIAHFRLKALEFLLNSQLQNQQVFNNNFNQSPTALAQSVYPPNMSSPVGPGTHTQQYLHTYGVVSVSGINAGAVLKATPTISDTTYGQLYYLQAKDTYTNTVYSFPGGSGGVYPSGVPQTLNITDDIFDHVMDVYVEGVDVVTNTTVYLQNVSISLNNPTIPE